MPASRFSSSSSLNLDGQLSLPWLCPSGATTPSSASFGDSLADTGNNPVAFDRYSVFDPVTRPPYGSTFFGRPTGRNCDGRLAIDFIAQDLGLPFVPPSLVRKGSFRRGANFAVGGATALDASFFHQGEAPGVGGKFPLNTSLGVQLQWFESLKPSLCNTAEECKKFFGRSLFFMGEFGVNDYHFSFLSKSVQEIMLFVPDIISTISMAIEEALEKLQDKHPDAMIIYADYFSPIMEMVESPGKFGFEEDILTICCGGPGTLFCGDPGAITCEKPSASLFWDGVHLTEAAYSYIANRWLRSINSPARESSK